MSVISSAENAIQTAEKFITSNVSKLASDVVSTIEGQITNIKNLIAAYDNDNPFAKIEVALEITAAVGELAGELAFAAASIGVAAV